MNDERRARVRKAEPGDDDRDEPTAGRPGMPVWAWAMIAVGAVVVLVPVGLLMVGGIMLFGGGDFADVNVETLPEVYTCTELWQEFEDNPVRAAAKFKNKNVVFLMQIDDYELKEKIDVIRMRFRAPESPIAEVKAGFKDHDAVSKTKKGDFIRVKGYVSDYKQHTLYMGGCELIEVVKKGRPAS